MSDPTLPILETTPVRVVFAPYDHDAVQTMLKRVVKDFGRPGARWRYLSPDIGQAETNVWILDFHFQDRDDAMVFALKYQR